MNSPIAPPARLDSVVLPQALATFRAASEQNNRREKRRDMLPDSLPAPLALAERFAFGVSLAVHGGYVLHFTARFLLVP